MSWHPSCQVWNFPRSVAVGVPLHWHSSPDHVCICIVGVPPHHTFLLWPRGQTCLLATSVYSDLGNFPLEPKCHGSLTAILVDIRDSILFYILYALYILYAFLYHTYFMILVGPMSFYWSCSPQKSTPARPLGGHSHTGAALPQRKESHSWDQRKLGRHPIQWTAVVSMGSGVPCGEANIFDPGNKVWATQVWNRRRPSSEANGLPNSPAWLKWRRESSAWGIFQGGKEQWQQGQFLLSRKQGGFLFARASWPGNLESRRCIKGGSQGREHSEGTGFSYSPGAASKQT